MRILNRANTPRTETRNIALTAAGTGGPSLYAQPWDTKNLPAGSGQRETLTAAVIAAVASDVADIAHFPVRVTQLGTGKDLTDADPIAYAFNVSPRAGMTAADLRAHVVYQLEYTGECYLVIVGNTVTPLLAASVDIIPAAPGQHNRDGSPALVAGFIVRNDRGRELGRYDAEGKPTSGSAEGQLVRIHHPYPGHPLRADAPVTRAGLAIDTLHYARQASAFVLRNSGQPAGLVQITDPAVTADSIGEFDRRLNSRLADVTQRGRILVVSSDVKYTAVDNDDPSTGIGALADMARRDVLSVWSMPESRLGLGGGRTYENQRVETSNYLRNTVAHRLGLIASALNQLARARGVVVEFALLAPELGEQASELAARAQQLYTSGLATLDEAREMVGLPPVAGGDRFATAPAAVQAPGAPARDAVPFAVAPEGATSDRAAEGIDADSWSAGYGRLADSFEGELADAVQGLHARAYRDIVARLRAVARAWDQRADEPAPRVDAEQVVNVTRLDTFMVRELEPLLDDAVRSFAGFAASQFDNPALVDLPRWKQLAARRLARLVKGVDIDGNEVGLGWSRQLAQDVAAALSAGYEAGESTGKLAARIAETLDVDPANPKAVAARALTIARTEANGLANETTAEAMRDSGVVARKRWYTVGDNRTRASHLSANGQEVDIDAKFNVGGVQMDRPHDPSAPAAEVVNCRCRMIPVVARNPLAD